MKRTRILLIAIASTMTACFSGCTKEQTLSSRSMDSISFTGRLGAASKAADITSATLQSFNVDALHSEDNTPYFTDAVFNRTDAAGTFDSPAPYYWSENGSLDFYAFAPASNSQVVKKGFNQFAVTPDATASSDAQADLIFATATGRNESNSAAGVQLNFRHALSKVIVQAVNSQSHLAFEVSSTRLCNVLGSGSVTLGESANADIWDYGTATATSSYLQQKEVSIGALTDSGVALANGMILVPQESEQCQGYATDGTPDGAFIAIELIIRNAESGELVLSDEGNPVEVIFPAPFALAGGCQYIYTVDLAGGGYKPSGEPDTPLDPILEDAKITFVSVTVQEWAPTAQIPLE